MLHRALHTPLRISAALIVALLLGVILAACGDDDKPDTSNLPANHFDKSKLDYGTHAPDFELPTPDGEMVALDDYLGREQPVLLFFHMAGG